MRFLCMIGWHKWAGVSALCKLNNGRGWSTLWRVRCRRCGHEGEKWL